VAAWNTRTATSNSLNRHSRRRKTDGKTAFMITCYHSARTAVTQAHRSSHDIVIANSIRFVTAVFCTVLFRFYFSKQSEDHNASYYYIIIPSLRHDGRKNTVSITNYVYIIRLMVIHGRVDATVGEFRSFIFPRHSSLRDLCLLDINNK